MKEAAPAPAMGGMLGFQGNTSQAEGKLPPLSIAVPFRAQEMELNEPGTWEQVNGTTKSHSESPGWGMDNACALWSDPIQSWLPPVVSLGATHLT